MGRAARVLRVFASEDECVLWYSNSSWEERMQWLMMEAPAGTIAVAGFQDVPHQTVAIDDPWASITTRWSN